MVELNGQSHLPILGAGTAIAEAANTAKDIEIATKHEAEQAKQETQEQASREQADPKTAQGLQQAGETLTEDQKSFKNSALAIFTKSSDLLTKLGELEAGRANIASPETYNGVFQDLNGLSAEFDKYVMAFDFVSHSNTKRTKIKELMKEASDESQDGKSKFLASTIALRKLRKSLEDKITQTTGNPQLLEGLTRLRRMSGSFLDSLARYNGRQATHKDLQNLLPFSGAGTFNETYLDVGTKIEVSGVNESEKRHSVNGLTKPQREDLKRAYAEEKKDIRAKLSARRGFTPNTNEEREELEKANADSFIDFVAVDVLRKYIAGDHNLLQARNDIPKAVDQDGEDLRVHIELTIEEKEIEIYDMDAHYRPMSKDLSTVVSSLNHICYPVAGRLNAQNEASQSHLEWLVTPLLQGLAFDYVEDILDNPMYNLITSKLTAGSLEQLGDRISLVTEQLKRLREAAEPSPERIRVLENIEKKLYKKYNGVPDIPQLIENIEIPEIEEAPELPGEIKSKNEAGDLYRSVFSHYYRKTKALVAFSREKTFEARLNDSNLAQQKAKYKALATSASNAATALERLNAKIEESGFSGEINKAAIHRGVISDNPPEFEALEHSSIHAIEAGNLLARLKDRFGSNAQSIGIFATMFAYQLDGIQHEDLRAHLDTAVLAKTANTKALDNVLKEFFAIAAPKVEDQPIAEAPVQEVKDVPSKKVEGDLPPIGHFDTVPPVTQDASPIKPEKLYAADGVTEIEGYLEAPESAPQPVSETEATTQTVAQEVLKPAKGLLGQVYEKLKAVRDAVKEENSDPLLMPYSDSVVQFLATIDSNFGKLPSDQYPRSDVADTYARIVGPSLMSFGNILPAIGGIEVSERPQVVNELEAAVAQYIQSLPKPATKSRGPELTILPTEDVSKIAFLGGEIGASTLGNLDSEQENQAKVANLVSLLNSVVEASAQEDNTEEQVAQIRDRLIEWASGDQSEDQKDSIKLLQRIKDDHLSGRSYDDLTALRRAFRAYGNTDAYNTWSQTNRSNGATRLYLALESHIFSAAQDAKATSNASSFLERNADEDAIEKVNEMVAAAQASATLGLGVLGKARLEAGPNAEAQAPNPFAGYFDTPIAKQEQAGSGDPTLTANDTTVMSSGLQGQQTMYDANLAEELDAPTPPAPSGDKPDMSAFLNKEMPVSERTFQNAETEDLTQVSAGLAEEATAISTSSVEGIQIDLGDISEEAIWGATAPVAGTEEVTAVSSEEPTEASAEIQPRSIFEITAEELESGDLEPYFAWIDGNLAAVINSEIEEGLASTIREELKIAFVIVPKTPATTSAMVELLDRYSKETRTDEADIAEELSGIAQEYARFLENPVTEFKAKAEEDWIFLHGDNELNSSIGKFAYLRAIASHVANRASNKAQRGKETNAVTRELRRGMSDKAQVSTYKLLLEAKNEEAYKENATLATILKDLTRQFKHRMSTEAKYELDSEKTAELSIGDIPAPELTRDQANIAGITTVALVTAARIAQEIQGAVSSFRKKAPAKKNILSTLDGFIDLIKQESDMKGSAGIERSVRNKAIAALVKEIAGQENADKAVAEATTAIGRLNSSENARAFIWLHAFTGLDEKGELSSGGFFAPETREQAVAGILLDAVSESMTEEARVSIIPIYDSENLPPLKDESLSALFDYDDETTILNEPLKTEILTGHSEELDSIVNIAEGRVSVVEVESETEDKTEAKAAKSAAIKAPKPKTHLDDIQKLLSIQIRDLENLKYSNFGAAVRAFASAKQDALKDSSIVKTLLDPAFNEITGPNEEQSEYFAWQMISTGSSEIVEARREALITYNRLEKEGSGQSINVEPVQSQIAIIKRAVEAIGLRLLALKEQEERAKKLIEGTQPKNDPFAKLGPVGKEVVESLKDLGEKTSQLLIRGIPGTNLAAKNMGSNLDELQAEIEKASTQVAPQAPVETKKKAPAPVIARKATKLEAPLEKSAGTSQADQEDIEASNQIALLIGKTISERGAEGIRVLKSGLLRGGEQSLLKAVSRMDATSKDKYLSAAIAKTISQLSQLQQAEVSRVVELLEKEEHKIPEGIFGREELDYIREYMQLAGFKEREKAPVDEPKTVQVIEPFTIDAKVNKAKAKPPAPAPIPVEIRHTDFVKGAKELQAKQNERAFNQENQPGRNLAQANERERLKELEDEMNG